MTIRPLLLTSLLAAFTVSTSSVASAGICDLTTNGATCGPSILTNLAIFGEVSPQPTGTGYIDPFLRLQENGQEEGYNTSFRPFQLDQKEPINYTHDLLLSAVPVVTIDDVEYRQFFLDINESDAANKELLSLDELRIYLSATGELNSYDATTKQLNGLTAIYDLDAGGDNWIKLNYSLNHGSGSGDMVAYIPNSLFTGASTQYLYLFSRFGDQEGYEAEADAGFEEWWVGPTTNPTTITEVPEPATLLLLGSGLTFAVRRRRKSAR
jgi:hypothetical protein